MKVEAVECWRTTDGKLFVDEDLAVEHELAICWDKLVAKIGQELDEPVTLAQLGKVLLDNRNAIESLFNEGLGE